MLSLSFGGGGGGGAAEWLIDWQKSRRIGWLAGLELGVVDADAASCRMLLPLPPPMMVCLLMEMMIVIGSRQTEWS